MIFCCGPFQGMDAIVQVPYFDSLNKDNYFALAGIDGQSGTGCTWTNFTTQYSAYYHDEFNHSMATKISNNNYRDWYAAAVFKCSNWWDTCELDIGPVTIIENFH